MAGPSLSAQAVAELVGGRLSGPGAAILRRVRSLKQAGAGDLSLCTGSRYAEALAGCHATAVLVPESLVDCPGPPTRIVVSDPARAMALVSRTLHPEPPHAPGIEATARIGHGTSFGEGAEIGAYVVIGANVTIGERVRLSPHVVIGDGTCLGDDVRLDAHVTLYEGVVLGSRVWCKAGSVIGGAGYGFASDASGHRRVPQVGGCILEDDVEIGSCSCVDRGSLDDTVIGRGSKLDNHVHVAHNVHLGSHCLLVAGAAIAGSSHLGNRVVLAGQSGVSGHLTLGDDVKVGGKAAVFANVASGMSVSGYPARPHREFLRALAALYRLAPHVQALEALITKEPSNG